VRLAVAVISKNAIIVSIFKDRIIRSKG